MATSLAYLNAKLEDFMKKVDSKLNAVVEDISRIGKDCDETKVSQGFLSNKYDSTVNQLNCLPEMLGQINNLN